MSQRKECGNCDAFIKRKNDPHSGGICDRKDQRTHSDSGRNCEQWSGIKYKRQKKAGPTE